MKKEPNSTKTVLRAKETRKQVKSAGSKKASGKKVQKKTVSKKDPRKSATEAGNKQAGKKVSPKGKKLLRFLGQEDPNYQALFDAMTEGVALHQMIYDAKGRATDYLIRDVNPSFERNTGIPVSKARGALGSAVYNMNPPPYLDIYEQVVRSGKPYFFKTYYAPMDRYFEISIFTPRKDHFATIFLDVTGFHNSQEELIKAKKEASFLSDLVEHSSQPYTISNLDDRIEHVNHAFTQLTGFSEAELKKKFLSTDLSPEEWFVTDEETAKEILRTDMPVRYEKEYLHKNGQRIRVEIFKHLARDEEGQPEFFYSFVTDITIRKQAEENLKNLNRVLEEKVAERTTDLEQKVAELNESRKALLEMVEDLNRTSQKLKNTQEELVRKERLAILGEFSGNISHELRNPLGVIDSSIYFLKMSLKDKNEKTSQHLERISNSVKHSISIIDNLLNLTRMSKPILVQCNFSVLISECLDSVAIPEEVRVFRDFPEEPIVILAENIQFKMVVSNLVLNAVSSMDGKGMLTVRIGQAGEDWAEVSFTDTGSGIPAENLEKIFQPLFSTKAKGIGLGLSLTKMIVENHGGRIIAESAVGKGSSFILRFPAVNEQKAVNNDFENSKDV
jgi:PAS domain S-box-containing protein